MSDFLKSLKELVFPSRCICCGKLADDKHLCSGCAPQLARQRIPRPERHISKKFDMVDGVYASYYYRDKAADAVKLAKFRNPASFLASFLEDISIDIMGILEENNIDMVVSSPYHKSRLYTQEYDLPREMAKRICGRCGAEYSQCIVKTQKTAIQHNLPKDSRKVNLVNAFEVTGDVKGKNILIIDDVITTGITASTLATDLKLAGAAGVYVWVYTYNT